MGRIGSLYEIMNKVIGLFVGPLFGMFLLGIFTKRANSLGVLAGGILGAFLIIYVAFFTDVSFIYTTTLGLLFTFTIGYLSSVTIWKNLKSNHEWTFKKVMTSLEEFKQNFQM